MANKKKEVELTKTKIVNKQKIELTKIDPQDSPIEKVEVSIFDKYRNLINMAKSDFITNYQYSDLIEILRYCEKMYGHPIPMNVNCSSCVIDLILMFSRLEVK